MLPRNDILAWRFVAPWSDENDVEQDLIITRALFDIFEDPWLADRLAFRGGTALHRMHLAPPARYSEDIDLVQRFPEGIGPTFDRLRERLGWIGKARPDIGTHPKIVFAFEAGTGVAPVRRKLKVEINTHEHFGTVVPVDYSVSHELVSRSALIPTYQVEELLGTKVRALYQRRKGRDLFDLWWAKEQRELDLPSVAAQMERYFLAGDLVPPTAAELRANLDEKAAAGVFEDVRPLLRPDVDYDSARALTWFTDAFLPLLD
jgi:predicted nucleotidyltransferase component of viral defense system